MEITAVEVGIAVSSGIVSAGLVWKFMADKLSQLEAAMSRKVEHESCELHRKQQQDKCGMIHSHMNSTLASIDKKFEQISEQIESLRDDRKNELKELTALMRETLNR